MYTGTTLSDGPKAKRTLNAHVHGLCKLLKTQKSQVDTRGRHSSLVKQIFGVESNPMAGILLAPEKNCRMSTRVIPPLPADSERGGGGGGATNHEIAGCERVQIATGMAVLHRT